MRKAAKIFVHKTLSAKTEKIKTTINYPEAKIIAKGIATYQETNKRQIPDIPDMFLMAIAWQHFFTHGNTGYKKMEV